MKKIILSILALAALASCTKDNNTEVIKDGYIRISSGIESSATSKAAVDNTTALTAVQFLRIDAASAPTSFADIDPISASRATNGDITFNPLQSHKENDHNAYFVAYHPIGSRDVNKITWAIDGKTDILLTKAIYNAGKYSAPLPSTGGENNGVMSFKHTLAQLEVKCVSDPSDAVSESAVFTTWGTITKIELLATNSKAEYNFASPTAMTYNTEAALTLLQSDYNTDFQPGVAIEKAPVNPITAAAMVAPVTTTGAFTLKVYTSTVTAGKEVTVQLKGTGDANKGLEVGKKHTVTLQFTAENKNIQVLSTSIEAWGDGYSGDSGLITP